MSQAGRAFLLYSLHDGIGWRLVRRLRFGYLFLPGWALPTPRFVFTSACCTSPRYALSKFRWAIPRVVLVRTLPTCHCCLALGSYVAISLALVALLHSARPFVSFALEDLALPYQTLINDLVGVLWSGKLNDYARCGLGRCVSSEPYDVSYFRLMNERSVVVYNLLYSPQTCSCPSC